jgi:dolichol-phosphate mannosyltransferase
MQEEALAVVMPVYNEAAALENVLREWLAEIGKLGIRFRIIAINDGSEDNSGLILDRFSREDNRLYVIHTSNQGHGPAILKGYRLCADVRWIFQTDSDNEIKAAHFISLWQHRHTAPLIIGARRRRQCHVSRKIITAAAGMLIGALFGAGHPRDVNCPYRLMDNRVFAPLLQGIPDYHCVPNMLVSGLAALLEMPFKEVDVPVESRRAGGSSIAGMKLLRTCARAIRHLIQYRISIKQ